MHNFLQSLIGTYICNSHFPSTKTGLDVFLYLPYFSKNPTILSFSLSVWSVISLIAFAGKTIIQQRTDSHNHPHRRLLGDGPVYESETLSWAGGQAREGNYMKIKMREFKGQGQPRDHVTSRSSFSSYRKESERRNYLMLFLWESSSEIEQIERYFLPYRVGFHND